MASEFFKNQFQMKNTTFIPTGINCTMPNIVLGMVGKQRRKRRACFNIQAKKSKPCFPDPQ